MNENLIDKRLLTAKELSVYLNMPFSTIYSKKCRGEFPEGAVIKLDNRVRFDKQVIDTWIDSKKI